MTDTVLIHQLQQALAASREREQITLRQLAEVEERYKKSLFLFSQDLTATQQREKVLRSAAEQVYYRLHELGCFTEEQAVLANALDAAPAPLRVKITGCSVPGAWYENKIGEVVTVFATDSYGHWTRDTGPLRCSQWIWTTDTAPAPSPKCAICDDSGIVRSVGRDNDEVISDCSCCATPVL